MKKHYVTFLSPGSFVSETNTVEVDEQDIDSAIELSRSIIQRYGAKPYGFYFTTRERGPKDFDSKEIDRSGIYYLGGNILTLKQIKKRDRPEDSILISNMECNGWERIIENNNSWRFTAPLNENDEVLDYIL